MSEITSKFGLYYKDNLHTLVGIDDESTAFTGRVPFGVHTIEDGVFANTAYESFSIPDSVKQVGFNLFENASKARSIKLPSALSELMPFMFSGCSALEKVTMPNVVTEFPEGLFLNCSSLKEVPFRTDIAYIGVKAFSGCRSLKSVVFPESVQIVEREAFSNCISLETIVIGSNLSEISEDSFANCPSVYHIRLAEDNPYFQIAEDGSLIRKADGAVVIQVMERGGVAASFNETAVTTEKLAVWEDVEEEDEEEDDTFSAEVGAADDEVVSMGAENVIQESLESAPSASEETSEIDMLSDILNQNSSVSSESASSSVSVSIDELSGVVDAMNEMNGTYTDDITVQKVQDRNLNILIRSVEYSCIEELNPEGVSDSTSDLYVIAEKTTGEGEEKSVSQKLKKCATSLASIQDLKRIIYLAGLPVDDDEFAMFLSNVLKHQHTLLACEAASPLALSEYCRKICEIGGIILDKEEILNQRRRVGIKNPGTIKLVVQDKF